MFTSTLIPRHSMTLQVSKSDLDCNEFAFYVALFTFMFKLGFMFN